MEQNKSFENLMLNQGYKEVSLPEEELIKLVDSKKEVISEGKIYCKNCFGEHKVYEHNGKITKSVRCYCFEEKLKQEEMLKEREEKFYKIVELKNASKVPTRYRDAKFSLCDFDKLNDEFKKFIEELSKYSLEDVNNGKGYYIFGGCGIGKTYITACLLDLLISKYQINCYFTTFTDIGNKLKDTFKSKTSIEKIIKDLSSIPVLFIDDIGSEKLESNGEENWMQEQIFSIVNKRYNNFRPIVFTSNYSLEELTKKGLNVKISDRIWEMSKKVIQLTGTNFRCQ